MIHWIAIYLSLGVLTLLVGELLGENLLATNRAAAEKAVPGSSTAVWVGVIAGALTAILIWPAYALGMLLNAFGKDKGGS